MRFPTFILAVATSAYVSAHSAESLEKRLVGVYSCCAHIHSSLSLELKADGTYVEDFRDSNVYVLGQKGPTVEQRDPGRWQAKDRKVTLLSADGKKRTLRVTALDKEIVVVESRGGKVFREYRK